MRLTRTLAAASGIAGAGAATYVGLVTARLTVDLGIGRRTRALGPIVVDVAAPREVTYAAATTPYAQRRPRAMAEKVRILERTDHMVLAAHRTPIGKGLTAVTLETVTFDPPQRIGFRLVRGPVPFVTETFDLEATEAGTRLTYSGELGTDLGRGGELWGDLVARRWESTVHAALEAIKAEAERRTR